MREYFDANGLLGRGAIFNQVYSDRSDGKTFNIKYRGLLRFKKHGYTTVYVRRWKTELTSTTCSDFLNEVLNIYPNLDIYDYKYDRHGLYARPKGTTLPYKVMFYFVPISVANRLKSSFDTTNIREIDFDEYVPLDNRYAPDEMINLIELYRTCDRDRNVVKLCTFGNRVTASTPFLQFFGLQPDLTVPKIRTYKNNTIAIQVYMNEGHREEVSKSPLTEALSNTVYDAYLNGGILTANNAVLRNRPKNSLLWARFKTNIGEGTIWQKDDTFYVCDKIIEEGPIVTDMAYGLENELVCTYTDFGERMKDVYRHSRLYATSELAWNNFLPIIHQANIK